MKAFFPAVILLLCTFMRFASSDFSYLVFVEAQGDRIKGDICYVNNKCDEVSILVILVRRAGEETWRRKLCREKAPVRTTFTYNTTAPNIKGEVSRLVCYTAFFGVVTQRSLWGGWLAGSFCSLFALKNEKLLVKDKVMVCFTAVLYDLAQRYYCGDEHCVMTKNSDGCVADEQNHSFVSNKCVSQALYHTIKTTVQK